MEVLKTLYFFLPAGMANIVPALFKKARFLNYPIDFNFKINKRPVIGSHKTYRGLFFGVLFAIITAGIQFLVGGCYPSLSIVEYTQTNFLVIGFLLGFGALFGDLVKSFFKRRVRIEPGKPWWGFDQTDWIIGAIILSSIIIKYSLIQIISLVIFYGIMHLIINLLGWELKIKKNKF
ncbi:MAG: CDP-archaeol synthase [Candidatus Thorarchaeota archaeon]